MNWIHVLYQPPFLTLEIRSMGFSSGKNKTKPDNIIFTYCLLNVSQTQHETEALIEGNPKKVKSDLVSFGFLQFEKNIHNDFELVI